MAVPMWELAIEHDPRRAYAQGPPNALVTVRRKKAEDHMTAVARVKREDFQRLNPDWYAEHVKGDVPTKVSLQDVVPTTIVPTGPRNGLSDHGITSGLCAACGVKPREGRYMKCAACRKRAQRV